MSMSSGFSAFSAGINLVILNNASFSLRASIVDGSIIISADTYSVFPSLVSFLCRITAYGNSLNLSLIELVLKVYNRGVVSQMIPRLTGPQEFLLPLVL